MRQVHPSGTEGFPVDSGWMEVAVCRRRKEVVALLNPGVPPIQSQRPEQGLLGRSACGGSATSSSAEVAQLAQTLEFALRHLVPALAAAFGGGNRCGKKTGLGRRTVRPEKSGCSLGAAPAGISQSRDGWG